MKAVVFALTLALIAPAFEASKAYVYKYEALLLGGLPDEGLSRAGIKVISKVLIGAIAPTIYMLKLVDPEIFEYSGGWPKDPFVPAAKLSCLNRLAGLPCLNRLTGLSCLSWSVRFPHSSHDRFPRIIRGDRSAPDPRNRPFGWRPAAGADRDGEGILSHVLPLCL
uniref:Vitellogenin domain-containing protein n=1 Tax=Salmo trutta TaxID=8032 RepID=A0A673XYQ9_SALTR